MQMRPPAAVAADKGTIAPAPRALADRADALLLLLLVTALIRLVLLLAAHEIDGFGETLGGALLTGPLADNCDLVLILTRFEPVVLR